jgi:hypothetical protein
MRSTNIRGRESARLSVSASREVDEKGPNRTLDVHELFTDTMPASVGNESPMCLLPADWDREVPQHSSRASAYLGSLGLYAEQTSAPEGARVYMDSDEFHPRWNVSSSTSGRTSQRRLAASPGQICAARRRNSHGSVPARRPFCKRSRVSRPPVASPAW